MKSTKKILSVILTVVMLFTTLPVTALAADPSGTTEQMLRISDEFEAANPNGAFSLASMAVETHEYSGRVVTEVIRQGGAAGRVEVTLRAIDVSARIGEDYSLRIPESFFTKDITGGGKSQTLLDGTSSVTGAALSYNTAHPTEQDDANNLSESEAQTDNGEAAEPETSLENREAAVSKASVENSFAEVSAAAVTGTAISGLRAARQQATGTISDRNKFAYTNRQKSELVNTARLAALDYYAQLPGTEFTLTFGDGERTRSIYIDILNDAIPEGDEQIILVITGVTGGGVVGSQKDTTINILDDEPYEEPVIDFSSYIYTAEGESATITLTRTAGLNYYAGGQISTVDGSAISGIDYTPLNQNFLFMPGQTQLQILVPVMKNESGLEKAFCVRIEPNESCRVSGDTAVQVLIPKAAPPLTGLSAALESTESGTPSVHSRLADGTSVTLDDPSVTPGDDSGEALASDLGITLGDARVTYGKDAANYTKVGSKQGNFFVNSGGWYEVNIQHDSINSGVQLNRTLYKSMLKSISTDMTLYKLRKEHNFDVWIDAEFRSEVTKEVKSYFTNTRISLPTFLASRNLLYGRDGYDKKTTNLAVIDHYSKNAAMKADMNKIGNDPFRLALNIRNGNRDYGAMRLYSITLNFRHFEFQIQQFNDTIYTFDFSRDDNKYGEETGPVGEIEITDEQGRKVKDFYTSENQFIFNIATKNVKPGYYLKELRFYKNTDGTSAYKTYSMISNGGQLIIDNDFLVKYNGYSMNTGSSEALLVQPVFARNEASLTVRLDDIDAGKGEILGVRFDDGSTSKTFTKNNTDDKQLHVGDKVVLTGVGNGSQAVTGYHVSLGNGSETGQRTATDVTDEHGAGIITLTLAESTEVIPIFGERAISVKPDPDANPKLRGKFIMNYNLHKKYPDYITFTEKGRLTGIESGKPVEVDVIPPEGYTTQWANRTGDTNGNGVLDDSEIRDKNGKLYRMYDYNQDGFLDAEYANPLYGDFLSYKVNQPQPLFYYNFVPLSGEITRSGEVTGYVWTREYDIRNGFAMDENGYVPTPVVGATVKMGGSYNPANPDAQIGYDTSTDHTGKFIFHVSDVIKNASYFLSIDQGGSSFFVDKINPSVSGLPYLLPTFTSMKPVSINAYPAGDKDETVKGSVVMIKKNKKVKFVLLTASLENNIRVAGADFRVYSQNGTLKSSHVVRSDMNRFEFTADLFDTFAQNDRFVVQLIDQTGGRSIEYNTGFELHPPLPATSILPSFAANVQKSVPLFGTVMGALDLGLAHFEEVYMDKDDITIRMGHEHAFDEYKKVLKETGEAKEEKDEDVIKVTVEDIENTKKQINNINKDNPKSDTNVKTKSTLTNNLSVNVSLEMKIKYDSKRPAGSGSPYYFHRLQLMVTLTDRLETAIAVSLPVGLTVTTTLAVGGSVTAYIAITPITPIGAKDELRVYADQYGNYPYYDSDMFQSSNYKFNVNGGVLMQPYISLTISGDYSVGTVSVEGRADFSLIFATDRDNSGTVKLSGHINVDVLGVNVYSKGLSSGTINLFGDPGARMMLFEGEEGSEQSTFAPISRDYLGQRSGWLGSEPILGDAGPLLSSKALQSGIYPDPDIQLMRVDEECILMVWVDDHPGRSDYNRAALYSSLSHDNGLTWSAPTLVFDDGTLDSNPRLVDLGDKILCLYSSLSSEIDSSNPMSMEEMLEANELEMRFFNKSTELFEDLAIDITRHTGVPDPANPGNFLVGDYTSDEYGNAVYDPVTKRILVIYTKSDYTSDPGRLFGAKDLFDTQKSYSTVGYRIYDAAAGKFLTYEEIGYPDGVDPSNAAEKAQWDTLWYGQKFLDTEILDASLPGGGITDPLVYDLTTALHGQTAYLAYTVDMDSDLTTTEDCDIYLATYNFADNTFTKPIKASDLYPKEQTHADGRPQLVSYENSVFLFYAADSEIQYVKANVLLDPGLLLDTSLLGEAGTGESDLITKESLPLSPHVALASEDGQHRPAGDYKVLTGDDGKLYLIWTESALRYADGVQPGSPEAQDPKNIYHEDQLYASAYYEDYNLNFTDEFLTGDTRTDYENLRNPEAEYGEWSNKVQLTFGPGSYNDVSADVMADGRILLAAKKNDHAYSEEHQMLLSAPDSAQLVAMTLVPDIKISAESDAVTFSPAYPKAGEAVTITAAFSNQGLLPLIRPVVNFYAVMDGSRQLIGSAKPGSALYAGEAGTASIDWTVPSDHRNLKIDVILTGEATDEIYADVQVPFPTAAELEYNLLKLKHISRNSYQVLAEVLNTGNQSLSGTEMVINLVDPMDHVVRELKRIPLENETGSEGLFVLRESFELANAELERMEGVIGGSASIEVRIEKNGAPLVRHTGTVVKDITALYGEQINAAERVDFPSASLSLMTGSQRLVAASVLPAECTNEFRMVYRSSDPSVASVNGSGMVAALKPGRAVISAYAVPDIELRLLNVDGYHLSADILDYLSPEDCVGNSVEVTVYTSSGTGDGEQTSSSSPVTPTPKPTTPVSGAVESKATVDDKGNASISITDQNIFDALANARAEAASRGVNAGAITLSIHISTDDADASSISVSLPGTVRQNMISNEIAGITFVTDHPGLILSLDLAAIKEIDRQSNADVVLTAARRDSKKLRKAAKKIIGSRPVYDFKVTDQNGKKQVTDFGSGKVYVSIPYTPSENGIDQREAVGYLYAVYVDAKGNAVRIDDSAYDTNSRSIIFTTNHFSLYGVGYTPPRTHFTDISGHWAIDSIDYVVARGLLSGTSKAKFSPDKAMTKGMLATALGRLAGVDVKAYMQSSLTDVKTESAILPYIEWAYKEGIMQDIGNHQFAPDRVVTREEIALILANFTKVTGYQLPVTRSAVTFADVTGIDSTYTAAVTAMQQTGIIMSRANNKFTPKASVTRAEVSSMLHRLIKLTIHPATSQGWAQNDDGQYLYYKDSMALAGWQLLNHKKYFFHPDGILKTGWVEDGDNRRYYPGNRASSGWQDIDNKRYYFTTDGLLVAGKWKKIKTKWYYFYADGALAKNTEVDGYKVDKNGVRKTKPK